jgi:hypothetical protein
VDVRRQELAAEVVAVLHVEGAQLRDLEEPGHEAVEQALDLGAQPHLATMPRHVEVHRLLVDRAAALLFVLLLVDVLEMRFELLVDGGLQLGHRELGEFGLLVQREHVEELPEQLAEDRGVEFAAAFGKSPASQDPRVVALLEIATELDQTDVAAIERGEDRVLVLGVAQDRRQGGEIGLGGFALLLSFALAGHRGLRAGLLRRKLHCEGGKSGH